MPERPVDSMQALAVGQRVWIYDINDRQGRGPTEGSVEKVGRKLVTISTGAGAWYKKTYRLDTQAANDNFGHSSFKTDSQRAEDERRNAALHALRDIGLEFRLGYGRKVLAETIEAIVSVVQAAQSDGSVHPTQHLEAQ